MTRRSVIANSVVHRLINLTKAEDTANNAKMIAAMNSARLRFWLSTVYHAETNIMEIMMRKIAFQ
jgi:hypothetical protein